MDTYPKIYRVAKPTEPVPAVRAYFDAFEETIRNALGSMGVSYPLVDVDHLSYGGRSLWTPDSSVRVNGHAEQSGASDLLIFICAETEHDALPDGLADAIRSQPALLTEHFPHEDHRGGWLEHVRSAAATLHLVGQKH